MREHAGFAAGRAVYLDLRHGPASGDRSHWVRERLLRTAFEGRKSLADFNEIEGESLGHRRGRQLAVDHGLQDLPAVQFGEFVAGGVAALRRFRDGFRSFQA